EGETLAGRIERRGQLEPDEAAALARDLAAALDAAHRAGVVHRDLKSSNVILTARGAVVTDFGLAKASGGGDPVRTGQGGLLGTPAYMAPEQVEGAEATPASDVYALGVLLYEAVTGRLPFAGATAVAIAAKRLQERPPSPRRFAAHLPRAWDATLAACLERDPARRPAPTE